MVSLFSIPAADSMENPLLAFQMVSKTFISTDLPTVCFNITVYSGHRNSSVVQKRMYVLRIRFFFFFLFSQHFFARGVSHSPKHLPS